MTGWRGRNLRFIAATIAGPLLGTAVVAAAEPGEPAHANRLIDSRSPYLLSHADNPVDWYPWGAEAFAKARRENKPIFLSVGYSTCYWCHVANRTLYSDPEIAALMNRWFVNVKVDREQLPDVDQVYMLARQLLTGQGGWPNNVFLTPDLKPFFAGSYFPPKDDGSGRPAFPSVLEVVHQAWTGEPDRVRRMADQLHAAMRDSAESLAAGGAAPVAPKQWLARARQILLQRFDPIHGGLRSAQNDTKFPLTPMLGLLLADYRISRHPVVLKYLTTTLDAMARGGIRDHLAGGFHRYSTERTWSVPHFEKMLYDNAQLLGLYANAYEATGNPLYRLVATSVGDYLSRRMTSPRGGFYTAEDSQVDGEEGASYLWTRDEIESILGAEDAHAFFEVYALAPLPTPLAPGSADADGRGVLRIGARAADAAGGGNGAWLVDRLSRLAPQRRKLLAARDRRPQPTRDDKIIVAQNGLAIRALAESGEILRIDRYGALARRAAERVWALAWDPGKGVLKHEIFRGQAQTDGYLADYALLGVAMMSLHVTTGDDVWLRRAGSLADALLRRFSRADGGLAITTGERRLLIVPEDTGDDIQPSGSSAAVALLLDLAAATGAPRYASAAARALRRLSRRIDARPEFWATAVIAVNTHPPTGDGGLASAGPGRFRMPDSADRVGASAAVTFGRNHDQITLTLDVDDGYHINANPASLDYLIATAVVFDGVSPTRIAYPEASRFKPAFAAEALDVYRGRVAIRATFPKGALAAGRTVRATATVQACNDQTCLPPADLPVVVDVPNPNPG